MLQTCFSFGGWAVFLHHPYSLLARRQPSCGECSPKTLYWLNSWAWKRCIHTSGVPNAEQMWNSLFKTDRLSFRLMLNQEEIPARNVLPNSGKISSENISQNKYGKSGRKKNDEYGTQTSGTVSEILKQRKKWGSLPSPLRQNLHHYSSICRSCNQHANQNSQNINNCKSFQRG